MKKKIKEKGKIIRFCSRCGEEWCKLGKILEYGKHYPAYVVKFKNGKKKEYSAFDEIKKAVCRECAKELFDNELLKSEKEKNRQKFIDALIWCSGSEDFQVGGKARKGWEKICLPLLKDEK